MDKERVDFRKNIPLFIILGVFSFLYVYFISYSTSPLYPYYYGNDSAQFQVIGKAWSDGLIPYRDMFDHKGPVIFFIDMIGYWLTGSSTGIMIIQVVFLFITLISFFKLTQLVHCSKIYSVIAIFLSLMVLVFAYSGGNYTEEYCLPFISVCTYFQVKYLMITMEQNILCHKPLHAFIYGASFGICLLTRVTNAITICAGTFVIACILLKNRKFKNLFQNASSFIAGALLTVLPFAIYFAIHDLFYDFVNGTLLFNIKYQAQMSSWIQRATLYTWIQFAVVFFTSYIIFIVAILSLRRKKTILAFYCFLCGALECYLFTSGASFGHYTIITLPQFFLLSNEIHLLDPKKRTDLYMKNILLCLIVVFGITCSYQLVTRTADSYREYGQPGYKGYEQLLNMVPDDEKNSFIVYGGNQLKELYLLYDITPCYKYFASQEWHASFSEQTREDIRQTFFNGNATWILSEGSTEVIQDCLDSRYVVFAEMDQLILYRLIETIY